ncbi:helix-turn-helix transcriptional regulator [Bacillus thuringiensis]|uniref:helix-turn-helix transcriptional regulator n=1 Tax=Bacillus thuringiensis TaxID=1428 RepID=UPI001F557552|nr:helix-turn-helix transcriptional regulator [Bacillus thuringiensis]
MKRFDGKKLYVLRKNRGFSQRELGELLECSHSLVNLMENGKLQPTTNNCEVIGNVKYL